MTFNYSTTMGDRRTMELLETFSEQYSSIYIVLQYQSKWTIKISIVANALDNYLSTNWKFLFGYVVPYLQNSFGMVRMIKYDVYFWAVKIKNILGTQEQNVRPKLLIGLCTYYHRPAQTK